MALSDVWTDAVRQVVDAATTATQIPVTAHQAVVTAVAAGGAEDGAALATVTWAGATFPAAHVATYEPTVGHRVLVLLIDGDPLIIGRVIGTPPLT